MNSAYDQLAREYYDPRHITTRNFDDTTRAALKGTELDIVDNGLVLDVGCGRGRANEFLGIPLDKIVQIDSSKEMLALENREKTTIRLHGDATDLPIYDAQFGAVVGFLVDPFLGLQFLSEAWRVLKPGGSLLITNPTLEWGGALRKQINIESGVTRFVTEDGQVVKAASNLVSESKMGSMLKASGFRGIQISTYSLFSESQKISPDIIRSAESQGVSVADIPVIMAVVAEKS